MFHFGQRLVVNFVCRSLLSGGGATTVWEQWERSRKPEQWAEGVVKLHGAEANCTVRWFITASSPFHIYTYYYLLFKGALTCSWWATGIKSAQTKTRQRNWKEAAPENPSLDSCRNSHATQNISAKLHYWTNTDQQGSVQVSSALNVSNNQKKRHLVVPA